MTFKGRKHSEESKQKIRLAFLGQNNPMYGIHNVGKDSPMYGKKHSEESKRKMSLSQKGKSRNKGEKNPFYNKTHSDEYKKRKSEMMKGSGNHFFGKIHTKKTKEKIKQANLGNTFCKGKKHSEETKQKMSISKKGKFLGSNNHFFGKKHSEETKEKMKKTKSHLLWKNTIGKQAIEKLKEKRKNWIVPKKDTSIEIKIQNFLKQLNISFFTHQYIKEIEHGYQCDILIPSKNLVIECDGNYWHKYPIGNEIDNIRTKELIEKGFKVLRLWEFEIRKMELNDFKERLDITLK